MVKSLAAGFALPTERGASLRWLAPLLLVFGVVIWQFHYGYIPYADQDFTIRGAIGWLREFPYLGTTHWELRHPFVISVAASLATFGISEWSLHLPSAVAGTLTVCVFYLAMNRLATPRAALVASIVFVTTPVLCLVSTTLYPDIFEALFWLFGLLSYVNYLNGGGKRSSLFLTGLMIGLAFLVRETAAQVAIALAVFYLLAVRRDFLAHFLIVLGFLLAVSFDLGFGYARHGDPFYRYVTDLQSYHPMDYWENAKILSPTFDNADEVRAAYEPETARQWTFEVYDRQPGPVSVAKWLDPYLLLFLNHEYGGLFFGLIAAAAVAAARRPGLRPDGRAVVLLLCVMAASALMINYVLNLRPLPRYYLIMVIAAAGLLGILLDALWRARLAWLAGVILALVLLGNVLGLDLRTPRLIGERLLAENPWNLEEPIHVDPVSYQMARFFLELAETPPDVRTTPPPPGGYYLHISDSTDRVTRRSQFRPGDGWEVAWRKPVRERWAGRLLRALGLQAFVPGDIYEKLLRPDSDVVLYRVAGG